MRCPSGPKERQAYSSRRELVYKSTVALCVVINGLDHLGEGAVSEEKEEGPDPEGQTVEKEGPPGDWERLQKK